MQEEVLLDIINKIRQLHSLNPIYEAKDILKNVIKNKKVRLALFILHGDTRYYTGLNSYSFHDKIIKSNLDGDMFSLDTYMWPEVFSNTSLKENDIRELKLKRKEEFLTIWSNLPNNNPKYNAEHNLMFCGLIKDSPVSLCLPYHESIVLLSKNIEEPIIPKLEIPFRSDLTKTARAKYRIEILMYKWYEKYKGKL